MTEMRPREFLFIARRGDLSGETPKGYGWRTRGLFIPAGIVVMLLLSAILGWSSAVFDWPVSSEWSEEWVEQEPARILAP